MTSRGECAPAPRSTRAGHFFRIPTTSTLSTSPRPSRGRLAGPLAFGNHRRPALDRRTLFANRRAVHGGPSHLLHEGNRSVQAALNVAAREDAGIINSQFMIFSSTFASSGVRAPAARRAGAHSPKELVFKRGRCRSLTPSLGAALCGRTVSARSPLIEEQKIVKHISRRQQSDARARRGPARGALRTGVLLVVVRWPKSPGRRGPLPDVQVVVALPRPGAAGTPPASSLASPLCPSTTDLASVDQTRVEGHRASPRSASPLPRVAASAPCAWSRARFSRALALLSRLPARGEDGSPGTAEVDDGVENAEDGNRGAELLPKVSFSSNAIAARRTSWTTSVHPNASFSS